MIVIYEKNETEFNNLGLGVLTPSKCTISEELNGIYELELTHHFDEKGKYKYLENERIILANTPNGYQPFRIYRIVPTLDNIVVNAKHIFYDLLNNFILNLNTNDTATNVLSSVENAFNYPMNFNFETDINKNGNVVLEKENPVSALLGTDEEKPKFIQAFGGEILRDKFNVKILESIGEDKGYTIRYGKNLLGLKIDEDYSNVITRLVAYGKDGINVTVDSDNINTYLSPKIATQEFNDISDTNSLKQAAKDYLKTVDKPIVNIEINFVLLSKTKEYENFKFLESVNLGDTVTIYNQKLNFSKKAKVISYIFDAISNNYEKIVLGDFLNNLADTLREANNKLNASTEKAIQLVNEKQNITDDDLETINKTITGAINELNNSKISVNDIPSDIAKESSPKNIENKVINIDTKTTNINNLINTVNNNVTNINNEFLNIARETTPKNIENKINSMDTKVTNINNKVNSIDTKTTTINNSINTVNTNVTNINNGLSSVAKESSPKNIENNVKSLQTGMSDLLAKITNLETEIKDKGTAFPMCQVIDFFNISSTKTFYSTFSEITVNIKANQVMTQETTKTIKIDNNTKVLTKLYIYYTPLENVLIVPFENFNTKQINLRVSNLNNKDVSVRVSLFFHYIEV